MNNEMRCAKEDARAARSKALIKEALLAVTRERPFAEVTVTALCAQAGVGRQTFYRHYKNTSDVLDEVLDEALEKMRSVIEQVDAVPLGGCRNCSATFCSFVREDERYRSLFMDDALAARIVEKLVPFTCGDYRRKLSDACTLTDEQLEGVVFFQLAGCLASAKRAASLDVERWERIQTAIDHYVKGGIESLG